MTLPHYFIRRQDPRWTCGACTTGTEVIIPVNSRCRSSIVCKLPRRTTLFRSQLARREPAALNNIFRAGTFAVRILARAHPLAVRLEPLAQQANVLARGHLVAPHSGRAGALDGPFLARGCGEKVHDGGRFLFHSYLLRMVASHKLRVVVDTATSGRAHLVVRRVEDELWVATRSRHGRMDREDDREDDKEGSVHDKLFLVFPHFRLHSTGTQVLYWSGVY